ncbi:MAG TPA: peptidylprolyl isomerase, partial [Edaphobacter sp.]|nr:peptidylprolyl isomerase [Edaphobacter sp.]
MTFRISQFRAVCGFSLLVLPVAALAQTPRYQSPLSVPNEPQQQTTLPTPTAITPNGTVVEDVVARVNDRIINRSDMERSEQQLAGENQQNQVPPEEAADRQKNLLRDMIDQQLLLSRAKELGLNADAEVIRRLDEIRKQNHMDSLEDLEKAARQQGYSFEDFKANIRNGILTQQVVRDEVGRHLQMTQGQEQAFYDAHKNDFAQPEQVRLSEILVPTPADATDAVVEQAKAKADGIAEKIKAGDTFEDLAKANSGGPTASQGGDLGLFKRGALAKVLEDQTFSLPAGGVTAPTRTRQGFVILKVTDHQQAGVPALKDIEPQT